MPDTIKYISLDEALEIVRTPDFELCVDGFADVEAAETATQAIVDAIVANIAMRLRALGSIEIERGEA